MCGDGEHLSLYQLGTDWSLKQASQANHVPEYDHSLGSGEGHYIDLLPWYEAPGDTATHQGCYVDNTEDRLLEREMYQGDQANTVEKCVGACREEGYFLAGVEYG